MKLKYIFTILFSFIILCADAKTAVKIPVDLISEITNSKEFKSNFNFAERIFVKQIIKNSSLNGIKLKKCNVDNLIEIFNKDNLLKKYGTNKLVEPITGITFEFNSDGKCKKKACSIIVDLGSFKDDNDNNQIQEENKMIFELKKNSKNELEITMPDID